jgi:hypothetical protein
MISIIRIVKFSIKPFSIEFYTKYINIKVYTHLHSWILGIIVDWYKREWRIIELHFGPIGFEFNFSSEE